MKTILLILSVMCLTILASAKPASIEDLNKELFDEKNESLLRKKASSKLTNLDDFVAKPLIQSILSNKTIQAVLSDPMVNSVLKNPRVQKVLANPIVQNILMSNSISEIKGIPFLQFLLARMAPNPEQPETVHVQKIKPSLASYHQSWTNIILTIIDNILEAVQKYMSKSQKSADDFQI